MFPALVHTSAGQKHLKEDIPPPIPPPQGRVGMSSLPTLLLHSRGPTYSSLQHIDELLPRINNEIRECKSQVAQDILQSMAINNKLLLYELCAIRIQAVVRQFISLVRVKRIKRRTELFLRITEDCAARYLEEFVLSSCFELSLEFYRQHRRFKLLNDSVERELVSIVDHLQSEVVQEMIAEVANDTISDVIDVVVRMRNAANLSHNHGENTQEGAVAFATKPVKVNPLVVLVDCLLDEAVLAFIRNVACQAIYEEAEEYLLQQHCERLYASVASEVVLEVLVDVIQIYFADQVDVGDALVGELYQRIYAQYHRAAGQSAALGGGSSSGGSGGGSGGGGSLSMVHRMQRRSTYRAALKS